MSITKKQWLAGGIGFIIAVSIGILKYEQVKTPATPGTGDTTATTTLPITAATSTTSASAYTGPFPINAADAIVLGSFKGAYVGNEALTAQANADIAHLNGLMGKGQYDDYDLYNGLANDYSLLGDGKAAYQNYNRAIAIHPKKGLAYVNLAHLMDILGARYTAADAYAKATTIEAGMLEYHIERLDYLTRVFPTDNVRITAAFTAVSTQFGDTAPILAIEAKWLTEQGRYADAVKAWETVKMLSPGKDTTSIDIEIARLRTKQ